MKTVIYILLFSLGLFGIRQHAHANTHNRKFNHSASLQLVKERFTDREDLVGYQDEDENDEDYLTRKFIPHTKLLSHLTNAVLLGYNAFSKNSLSSNNLSSSTISDICIAQRVLRI